MVAEAAIDAAVAVFRDTNRMPGWSPKERAAARVAVRRMMVRLQLYGASSAELARHDDC